jgi:hypothetical protein
VFLVYNKPQVCGLTRKYDHDAATRKTMEAQDKPVDGMPTPEIIAALLNYARLSHRIKLAASEAPGAMAAALLAHLVKLCKAERGAVLIPSQSPGERQQSFPASAREVKDAL